MKVYTEINYEWLDNQLVETSSKYFEYEGEVILCGATGGGGNPITTLKENIVDPLLDPLVETFVEEPLEETMETISETTEEALPEEEEPEPAPVYGSSSGVASLQGQNAALSINKKTEGAPGAFTRGSLRVRKPKRIAV